MQAEFMSHSHQMVEYVGLLLLVICPSLVIQEEIDFYRQAVGCCLFLRDYDIQRCIHFLVLTQVCPDIQAV